MRRCALVFDAPDGGVAEHMMRLALGLRERDWEPWLIGPEAASIYTALEPTDLRIVRLPFRAGYGHPLDDVRVLRAMIGLLRRNRFDLVSTHSPKIGAIGRLAALTVGVPIVTTAHGFAFNPAVRAWPGRAFSLAVERSLARRTAAIICVSNDVRRLALGHHIAPAEKLHTVYHGTPACDDTVERDPDLERFSAEGPLAGCVTALRPDKGVDVFLESAPEVLRRLPEARLAVVGNGAVRPDLERYAASLGLDGRLRFFSYLPPSARQMKSLDVFVLPSPWDALSIGALEALACGIPQVATNAGGVPEAVADGETGLLCPPNDPPLLAQRIVRLLGDSGMRERMSEASRERHRRLFGIERMVSETAAVFDRVLSAR